MEPRPTRSQVIGAMIFSAVLESRTHWNTYAEAVVQHYHAHVATTDRVVKFHVASTAADVPRCQDLNTQAVKRMLTGEYRMLVDMEESLLAALPDAQRDAVRTALLARDGLLLARQPAPAVEATLHAAPACELMRRTADVLERVSPMIANGNGIGPEDAVACVAARNDLRLLLGACITLDAQFEQAMMGGRKAAH